MPPAGPPPPPPALRLAQRPAVAAAGTAVLQRDRTSLAAILAACPSSCGLSGGSSPRSRSHCSLQHAPLPAAAPTMTLLLVVPCHGFWSSAPATTGSGSCRHNTVNGLAQATGIPGSRCSNAGWLSSGCHPNAGANSTGAPLIRRHSSGRSSAPCIRTTNHQKGRQHSRAAYHGTQVGYVLTPAKARCKPPPSSHHQTNPVGFNTAKE